MSFSEYPIRFTNENVDALLSDPRVDPSAFDNYAIRTAAENGEYKVVEALLADDRVDPTACDNYAIRIASEKGHLEVARVLFAHPKVDAFLSRPGSFVSHDAIHFAEQNGYDHVARLLKTVPVDPSACDNYAIRFAAENGHLEIVRLLMSHPKVDPTDRDNEAVELAKENNHHDVVSLLTGNDVTMVCE